MVRHSSNCQAEVLFDFFNATKMMMMANVVFSVVVVEDNDRRRQS